MFGGVVLEKAAVVVGGDVADVVWLGVVCFSRVIAGLVAGVVGSCVAERRVGGRVFLQKFSDFCTWGPEVCAVDVLRCLYMLQEFL